MSAKTIIQNLEDSQLIRIFLDFVQTFHLQYQKIDKEISYKCHEATWILSSNKATGYGRTESEAYKHALRNLLEILIEDPQYSDFFTTLMPTNANKSGNVGSSNTFNHEWLNSQSNVNKNKNKTNTSKPPLYSHLSASLTSSSNAVTLPPRRELRTQSGQIEKGEQYTYNEPNSYNQQSSGYYYQHAQNSQSGHKLNKYQTNSYQKIVTSVPTTYTASNVYAATYKKTSPPPTSFHTSVPHTDENKKEGSSKANMIRNDAVSQSSHNIIPLANASNDSYTESVPSSHPSFSMNRTAKNEQNVEMEAAKARTLHLQQELENINQQNALLRTQLEALVKNVNLTSSVTVDKNSTTTGKSMRLSLGSNQPPNYLNSKNYSYINNSISPANSRPTIMKDITNINPNGSLILKEDASYSKYHAYTDHQNVNPVGMGTRQSIKDKNHSKSKVLVPKLKLEILPNYHGKAQKSLNDSLMAVYEQKHGNENKQEYKS